MSQASPLLLPAEWEKVWVSWFAHSTWILPLRSTLSDSNMDGILVMPHNYDCMAEYDICSRMLLSNTQLNAAKYGWWVWIIALDRSIIKFVVGKYKNNNKLLSNWTTKNVFGNFCFLVTLFRDKVVLISLPSYCSSSPQELFLVPDHKITDINGASFAGFYYICFQKSRGTIEGYYYHKLSEW